MMKPSEAIRFVEVWTGAWNEGDDAGLRELFVGHARLRVQVTRSAAPVPHIVLVGEAISLYLRCASALRDVRPLKTDHYVFDCVRPELEAWFTYGSDAGNGAVRVQVCLDGDLRIVHGVLRVHPWPSEVDQRRQMRLKTSLEGIPMAGHEEVEA